MNNIVNYSDLMSDYENEKLVYYDDCGKDAENTYSYDELGESSSGGLPLISRRIDGKLYVTFTEDTHVLVLGATRSGKTTGYILPTVFHKAHQKRKDSMLLTDPKGELYAKCGNMLREQGYKVEVINFRDYKHSEFWNPLTPIFRKYREAKECFSRISVEERDGEYVYSFDGKTFKDRESAAAEADRRQREMLGDLSQDIDTLALTVAPTVALREPYWEDSARQLFIAFIWGMLEDSEPSVYNAEPITEDTFSFRTILSAVSEFGIGSSPRETNCDNGYFSSRPRDSIAYITAKEAFLNNAPSTRQCVLSSFTAKLAFLRSGAAQAITCCNTFDLRELLSGDEPVAIFIIYRDEAKTSYQLIQMFVTCAYNILIETANAAVNLRLARPFYFILDEFGNLPQIVDFETTISACGSRNIWFVLVLQSYAQMARVYGEAVSDIIADNMNMKIFIGSNNAATKRRFSEECGRKTVISPISALNGSGVRMERYEKETVPLVPVSRLGSLKPGECIVTRAGAEAVLWSKIERSYLCPEFDCEEADILDYETKAYPYDKKYIYCRTGVYANKGGRRS